MTARWWRRRWHYHAFFHGDRHIDVGLEVTKEEVTAELDTKYPGGNWEPASLVRGKKIKLAKAQRKEKD